MTGRRCLQAYLLLSARTYCGFKSSVKDASCDLRANGSRSNANVRTWRPASGFHTRSQSSADIGLPRSSPRAAWSQRRVPPQSLENHLESPIFSWSYILVSATGEVRPSDRPNRPTDRYQCAKHSEYRPSSASALASSINRLGEAEVALNIGQMIGQLWALS